MIKLGSEVKDIVSGLKGKAVARCEWLQESAKPIILVEVTTEPSCMVWLDEDRLEELPPMT